MRAITRFLWLALAASLVLTGCSSGEEPASNSGPASVTATALPVRSTVAVADTVTPATEASRAAALDPQPASPTPTEPAPTATEPVATAVMTPTETSTPTKTSTPTATATSDAGLTPEQQALLAGLPSQGVAPELNNAVWLNSDPLKLADQRGKVVLLDMWTFG